MARQARLVEVIRRGGRVIATFADKSEVEFASIDDVRQWADSVNSDSTVRKLAISLVLAVSPDLTDLSRIRGRDVILDFEHAQPLRIR